jgi:hypothetical protein
MSKQARTSTRLLTRPKIRPLDPNKPLAPYQLPALPAGKFKHVDGQAALDFGSETRADTDGNHADGHHPGGQ